MDNHPAQSTSADPASLAASQTDSLAGLYKRREWLLGELAVVNIDIRHILDEIKPFAVSSVHEEMRRNSLARVARRVQEEREKRLTRATGGDKVAGDILKALIYG